MLSSWFRSQSISSSDSSLDVSNEADHGVVYCNLEQLAKLKYQAAMLSLPSARRALRQQSGLHHSPFKGRGIEFAEVRLYQPGDDVRSIDWRVTARRQTPHTKLYHEEREQPVYIMCDQTLSQFFGSKYAFKSVRSAQAAAMMAWQVLSRGDRVGGTVFSDDGHRNFKAGRSRKKVMAYLNALAEYNQRLNAQTKIPDTPFTLNEALNESRRYIHPGALVIIISDFYSLTSEGERQLHLISRHNELILIQTSDPLDQALPPPGYYPVSNGSEVVTLDTNQKQFIQRYQQDYLQRQSHFKELTQKIHARHVEISTAASLSDNLKSMSALLRL
jgi:uncharacterized protein (DUF58 family)